MDEFLGTIKIFGFNFAPRGWMLCQGQRLSIAQNTALFSLLGTTYGGDGVTTFSVPDLRGRTAIGMGNGPGLSPYTQGQQGGNESVTLTTNQMPTHVHPNTVTTTVVLQAENAQATAQNPNGKCLASGTQIYADTDAQQMRQMNAACAVATTNVVNAPAGGNQATPILPPYLCVNYSICTEGLFPSRN